MIDGRKLIMIASNSLSAEVDPLGAQLFSLRDEAGRDLQWDGDPKFWTGRAPILFPIVGMLEDSRYRLGDHTYVLPQHGFARHSLFEVVQASGSSVILRLGANDETLKVYPFRFQLDLVFDLSGATLSISATIRNMGEAAMPASFGFHPALRWPLPYSQPRADHRLVFANHEPAPIRRIFKDGVVRPETYPTPVVGDTLILKDALFQEGALIFDKIASQSLTYGASEGPHLRIDFPDTPYLGVWMKPGADYVCVEPWHGIADPHGFHGDFRDKPGVFEVAPGEARLITMSITLNP